MEFLLYFPCKIVNCVTLSVLERSRRLEITPVVVTLYIASAWRLRQLYRLMNTSLSTHFSVIQITFQLTYLSG
jgi:hypothetical protein